MTAPQARLNRNTIVRMIRRVLIYGNPAWSNRDYQLQVRDVKESINNSIMTDNTGARPHGNPDIKKLGPHRFTRKWCDSRNVSMVS